ncbi:MAG TPA: glucoamylase family protein, partial [Chitinophagaceae bacterium]|nr:glucoamylase family protein [Chitinophagaceae bacterium]
MRFVFFLTAFFLLACAFSCTKNKTVTPAASLFTVTAITVNGVTSGTAYEYKNVSTTPIVKFSFSTPIKTATASSFISLKEETGTAVSFTTLFENNNSIVTIKPQSPLKAFSKYTIAISNGLTAENEGKLSYPVLITLHTGIDSTDKFPLISDSALLDLVQQQTFKYFWDFGHPVSGLARERNTSADVVTSGGSGFGIMSLIVGVHRQFITRMDGLERMQKIVSFLKTKAQKFHGAFPHWLNGSTGAVVPFSAKDNGADLVETSYLMQGLLTARQYFDKGDAGESTLRNDINELWNEVEWSWFRKGGENVLYWHWSPDQQWAMNMPVKGWNEALITYVLAAASTNYSIPKSVYDAGWAANGAMKNGNNYYGHNLQLGPPSGGPLFFAHYSFLGINPTGLSDAYADYFMQNKAHTLINQAYCIANPKGFAGYSDACWGLTASDDNKVGYMA